jgi:hypothetical protein
MLFVLNQKQACEQGPLSILKGSTFGSLLKDICFAQARLRSSNLHLRPFQITPATCKSPCRERSPLCSQNSHRATTGDHVTIQNGHRATTPAHFVHKIRTAPQRETTLRFKMATAPQRQPTLFTKFAPRHNGRPRYDPKLSPRHTRTLNHNLLLAQRE